MKKQATDIEKRARKKLFRVQPRKNAPGKT